MTDLDTRLDHAIDALNREASPAIHESNDPDLIDLVDAARIVKSLREPAEPDATFVSSSIERLSQELAPATAGNGIPRAAQPTIRAVHSARNPKHLSHLRSWLRDMSELAAVLLVIALVLTGIVLYQTVFSGSNGQDEAVGGGELSTNFDVYVTAGGGTDPRLLVPVNRDTLQDRSDLSQIEFEPDAWFTLSYDGSTLARIEYAKQVFPSDANLSPNEVTIVVQDGLRGAERIRFHPPEHVNSPILSNDGSRLVVQSRIVSGETEPPTWYIFDTSDGRLISTIQRDSRGGNDEMFFSADATRLYRAGVTPASATDTPEPLRIMVYDVATGDEIDRPELTDVPSGAWQREPNPQNLMTDLIVPAVVLSPDGRQIAIVHADKQAVTLVDAESLAVERTIQLSDSDAAPWFEQPARESTVQVRDNIEMDAEFSPDGRYLYVHGQASIADERGIPTLQGTGLILVDLEQGTVLAHALENTSMSVVPAPDGSSVYVTFRQSAMTANSPQILQRLDAHTLDVLAERSFPSSNEVIIDRSARDSDEDGSVDVFPTPTPEPSDGPVLMVSEQSGEALPRDLQIQPVDPVSLKPMTGKEPFNFGHHYTYTFSPDGQTLAAIIWPSGSSNNGGVLHFFGLESWTDTTTDLTFDNHVGSLIYSSDGSRLYWASPTWHDPAHGMPRDYELYCYDIAQNTVTTVLRFPESFSPREMKLLNSDSRMAVYGNPIDADTNLSEGPPRIMIVDLASGAVDADVELPGVIAWQHREENDQGETEYVIYTPGLAWDVERSRLYVVHADEDVVTIVDLELGAIVNQQEIESQASLFDSFMNWLVPEAAAKGGQYVQRSAWLSEDGSRLYATGNGLQVIDIETLTELQRLDTNISTHFPVSDGERLLLHTYSGTIESENLGTSTTGNRLVLLDPVSLDEIGALDIGHPFQLYGISEDGRYAYLSQNETNGKTSTLHISVVDIETMEIVSMQTYENTWYAGFLSP